MACNTFFTDSGVSTAQFFIGVDGGATRCRARLRAASGRALAEDTGPAANIYVDFDAGLGVMRELVATVIAKAGLGAASRGEMALGVGLAGLSSAQDAGRVAAALPGWARVEVANDAVTACIGANGSGDGGLIIAGTGTAGIARIGRRRQNRRRTWVSCSATTDPARASALTPCARRCARSMVSNR